MSDDKCAYNDREHRNLQFPDVKDFDPYFRSMLGIMENGSGAWKTLEELSAYGDEPTLLILTVMTLVEVRVSLDFKMAGFDDEYQVQFRFTGARGIAEGLKAFFSELQKDHEKDILKTKTETGSYPASIIKAEVLQWRLTDDGMRVFSNIRKNPGDFLNLLREIAVYTPAGAQFAAALNIPDRPGSGITESIKKNAGAASWKEETGKESAFEKLIKEGFNAIQEKLVHVEKKLDAGNEKTIQSIEALNLKQKEETNFEGLATTLYKAAVLFHLKDGCLKTEEVSNSAKRMSDKWRMRLERNPELKAVSERKKGEGSVSYYQIRPLAAWIYENEPARPCSLENFIEALSSDAMKVKDI